MAKKQPDPVPAGRSFGEWFRGTVVEWTTTALLLLFGFSTLLQAYVVPTASMESTILIGDHVFVDKLVYSPPGSFSKHLLPYQEPKRGDIIVFRYPVNIRDNYVKRVIGVPGDRIRLEHKKVYLNGKPLDEPYVQHVRNFEFDYADNFPPPEDKWVYPHALDMLRNHVKDGELVVPPGMYFAMGDNRDNSEDSRFWGFVPRENIIGKPLLVYWSYDAPTENLMGYSIGHFVDIATNFFSKTRWDRTMRFVHAHSIP
ncbi:MAG: signal peptidase I [Bryobacterales bacterium]|nr:signal peptidase I [Bryobacterales bacterium]